MKSTLTKAKVDAIIAVLTINKDSADLMIKRGVDPLEVHELGRLAKTVLRK